MACSTWGGKVQGDKQENSLLWFLFGVQQPWPYMYIVSGFLKLKYIFLRKENSQDVCLSFFFFKGYHLLVGDRIFPYQSVFALNALIIRQATQKAFVEVDNICAIKTSFCSQKHGIEGRSECSSWRRLHQPWLAGMARTLQDDRAQTTKGKRMKLVKT